VVLSERNPKWEALTEVLKEISDTEETLRSGDQKHSSVARVLVAVDSQSTCSQLKDYILHGATNVLSGLLARLDEPKQRDVWIHFSIVFFYSTDKIMYLFCFDQSVILKYL